MAVYPDKGKLVVSINGVRIGLVLFYRESRSIDLQHIGAVGENTATVIFPTTRHYAVTLRRLLPDGVLLAKTMDSDALDGFTLDIEINGTTVRYERCEFASVTTSCEADNCLIEEAEIHAATRIIM